MNNNQVVARVVGRVSDWIREQTANEPEAGWVEAVAQSKAASAAASKRLKALETSKKPKLVVERESLEREETARASSFRDAWLARAWAMVESLRSLHSELADNLAKLDALFLAERAALSSLATPAELAASVRLFYDGTPDKLFSNFAPFPFALGQLEFPKGEKLFHLVKVVLCGDRDCAWAILNTNDAVALRALGRDARGYDAAIAAGWEDVDSGLLLLVCIVIKEAAVVFTDEQREGGAGSAGALLLRELVSSAADGLYVAEGARDDSRCGIGFHATDGAPLDHVAEWGRNALGHACMAVGRYHHQRRLAMAAGGLPSPQPPPLSISAITPPQPPPPSSSAPPPPPPSPATLTPSLEPPPPPGGSGGWVPPAEEDDPPPHSVDLADCADIDAPCAAAAAAIADADYLLIVAGAGCSADAGLMVFSQVNAQAALASQGLGYDAVASLDAFARAPARFYGFWAASMASYARAAPHAGYGAMRRWAERAAARDAAATRNGASVPAHSDGPLPRAFVLTSNVDGLFVRAKFGKCARVGEIHGSVRMWQCGGVPSGARFPLLARERCGDSLFAAPAPFAVAGDDRPRDDTAVDLTTLTLRGAPPCCPRCGGGARPNVMLFGDGSRFAENESFTKTREYFEWRTRVAAAARGGGEASGGGTSGRRAKVAIVEVGCGLRVPTLRKRAEELLIACGSDQATLVRVNPEFEHHPLIAAPTIAIRATAARALACVDAHFEATIAAWHAAVAAGSGAEAVLKEAATAVATPTSAVSGLLVC